MHIKFSKALIAFTIITQVSFAQTKIEFTAPDIYPEGIAYNSATDVFYVSGVRYGTIGKLTTSGMYTEIFRDTTLRSTYGMKLDPAGKKLWFCAGDANYSKYASDATHKKMIRLIAIDLASGKKVNDIDLSNVAIGQHFANDLTMDKEGNIYITDSFSPNIYKIDGSGKATLFATGPLLWSANIGLNGIVYHPGGYLIAINSGAGCLVKINIANPVDMSKVKIDQFFPGGDGLLLNNNNSLTLVQNQAVNKIFMLRTTDDWQSAKVVMATKAAALFQQPSTAAKKGNETWIMNSKLNELADSAHVPAKKFSVQKAEFFAAD